MVDELPLKNQDSYEMYIMRRVWMMLASIWFLRIYDWWPYQGCVICAWLSKMDWRLTSELLPNGLDLLNPVLSDHAAPKSRMFSLLTCNLIWQGTRQANNNYLLSSSLEYSTVSVQWTMLCQATDGWRRLVLTPSIPVPVMCFGDSPESPAESSPVCRNVWTNQSVRNQLSANPGPCLLHEEASWLLINTNSPNFTWTMHLSGRYCEEGNHLQRIAPENQAFSSNIKCHRSLTCKKDNMVVCILLFVLFALIKSF